MGQLTLDGGEVDEPRAPARRAPLSPAQLDVMALLRRQGSIRSVEAGVIAHAHRAAAGRPCGGAGARSTGWRGSGRAVGCCAYAPVDGNEVMKRLAERGLARRDPERRGRWLPL